MGFEERIGVSEKMHKSIIGMLKYEGFEVENSGYENFISSKTMDRLGEVHNNPTVTFLRYLPDLFVWEGKKYFFVELKVMSAPIKYDGRVKELIRISGHSDLSKENIGAVETAAIENYAKLESIGVEILVIVYCTFHPEKLLVEWGKNLVKFHKDKVRIGEGNASFTPYTNIHLDKMSTIQDFFEDEFGISIDDTTINKIKKELTK